MRDSRVQGKESLGIHRTQQRARTIRLYHTHRQSRFQQTMGDLRRSRTPPKQRISAASQILWAWFWGKKSVFSCARRITIWDKRHLSRSVNQERRLLRSSRSTDEATDSAETEAGTRSKAKIRVHHFLFHCWVGNCPLSHFFHFWGWGSSYWASSLYSESSHYVRSVGPIGIPASPLPPNLSSYCWQAEISSAHNQGSQAHPFRRLTMKLRLVHHS